MEKQDQDEMARPGAARHITNPPVTLAERINRDFTYHPPKGDQQARYVAIREEAKELAHFIRKQTPASREQSLALTHLEESIFWANAAIARNE